MFGYNYAVSLVFSELVAFIDSYQTGNGQREKRVKPCSNPGWLQQQLWPCDILNYQVSVP